MSFEILGEYCCMRKTPAPLFGEGFSEEARKITTLTKYLELETWTPIEAAMLVCGLQPPQDCHEIPKAAMNLHNAFMMGTDDPFHQAKRVLQLWNSRENAPAKITPSDFVAWCQTKGINTDWLNEVELTNPQPDLVMEKKGRKDRQITAILEHAKSLNYPVKNIPRGGKKAIEKLCLKDVLLFTDTSFHDAWKQASKQGLLSVENKDQYSNNC